MVNSLSKKRILELVLSVLATIVMFFVFGMCASAKTYNSIQLDVPRISQRPNTGDCAIASMATVEAYMHGLPAGDYNSRAYQAVYSANGYSISASWSTLGFQKIEGFDMETAYSQLETGYPIIAYRSSSHYSVIYGYNGSTSSLELSGFKIVDVDDSYNSTTAYKSLDKWKGGYSLTRMVVRLDGLAISANGITFACNHPSANHSKGNSFTARGMVLSNKNLTSVTVSVKTSAGVTVKSYSATPNSTSFAVSSANGALKFNELAVGSYYYSITAKDSSGATKTYNFDFKVIGNSAVPVVDPTPTIKEVSYTAIVTAGPLNLRLNPSMDATVLTTISVNEKVPVTAESSNGWAKVTYKTFTGWVSMDYIEKYTEPEIDIDPSLPLITENSNRYARCTASTSIKSTAFLFSSNVASVPKNAILRILGVENGWVKVTYNTYTGYMSLNVLVVDVFDVDSNGIVNSADALLVIESSTGRKTFTDSEKKVADANGDGVVNSADALIILQVSTGAKSY